MKVSIGWIAKHRGSQSYGGHNARCKVYATEKVARSNNRFHVWDNENEKRLYHTSRNCTDAEQDERYEFHEVFYEQG